MIECYAILLLLTINNHCISVCLNKSIVICRNIITHYWKYSSWSICINDGNRL